MTDCLDSPPLSKTQIRKALGPTIHYSTSPIESVPACGKKGVATSTKGDKVDCKSCRRRFVRGKSGQLFYDDRWTAECSGCEGEGCHECGYTGKRRGGFHAPINDAALDELGIK